MAQLKNIDMIRAGDEFRLALSECAWLPIRAIWGITVGDLRRCIGEGYEFRRRGNTLGGATVLFLDERLQAGDLCVALHEDERHVAPCDPSLNGVTPREFASKYSGNMVFIFIRPAKREPLGFTADEASEVVKLLKGVLFGEAAGVRSMNSVNTMLDLLERRFADKGHNLKP
jgi:hypothetical protein